MCLLNGETIKCQSGSEWRQLLRLLVKSFQISLRYNPHDLFAEKTGCNIHIYDYKKEYGNKAMLSVLPPVWGKGTSETGDGKER